MTEPTTNVTTAETPIGSTQVLAEPSGASSVPTEHEQPSAQPAGTPLMNSGLLPAAPEAPSEEAIALDREKRDEAEQAALDAATMPTEDANGKTLVGVTNVAEAHALPEIDGDEHAEPFEGHPRFIRAFHHYDGRTMRVVHHDDGLAVQEVKAG